MGVPIWLHTSGPSRQWVYPGLVDVPWDVVHLCLPLCLPQLPPLLGQGTLGQRCSLQGSIRVLQEGGKEGGKRGRACKFDHWKVRQPI